ncbi:MAG: flavodoxin domain-containing protein [Candidatus Bathyarchaeota archaeon]|nr:flavodoxin domain-containing protein [Candidatus Bathyarchaeota archaeon]
MNALVVYYSRTGTTRKVAEKIASLLKCVSEEIHDTTSRKGKLGWLRAGKDATSEKLTKLEKVNNDPASFDIIIIGTPKWNRRLSTPIRTYITEHKDRFKKVAFFCTYQYTDDDPFDEMESLCGKTAVATLRLHRKKEVEVDQYIKKTEEFIERLAS